MKHNICIVGVSQGAYSETFVRNHITRLPANVKVLYGGSIYHYKNEDGIPIIKKPTSIQKLMRSITRRVKILSADDYEKYFRNSVLKKYLMKNKIEAVLAEFGPAGVKVMNVCDSAGIPLIVHFHGYDANNKNTLEREKHTYSLLFSIASAIIVTSNFMEKRLIQIGALKDKIHIVPCGVDTKLFYPKDKSSSNPVFVSVGRFVSNKGPHLTILAFKKVVERYENAKLIMIGEGKLLEVCKQLARALKIEKAIDFPGVLSHEEVAEKLQNATALVQHSLVIEAGDSEGFGLSIAEAGAVGIPVIATRAGGIPDIVVDKQTGYLVNEKDIDGMADCMIKLIKEPELAKKMGENARERICNEFSLDKSISNLWKIIEQAIINYKKV